MYITHMAAIASHRTSGTGFKVNNMKAVFEAGKTYEMQTGQCGGDDYENVKCVKVTAKKVWFEGYKPQTIESGIMGEFCFMGRANVAARRLVK